jgi:GMP synthase-like glutamine amidotransferase
MKPIAIIRHSSTEGPGYFATFLEACQIPWRLIAVDQGESVPDRMLDFSGLCLMGGPMSVNDPLPWISQTCSLIREAVALDKPVIGHCLGGQLISKAMGGNITSSPVKEIGWGNAHAEANSDAKRWLGNWLEDHHGVADVFQWHGETFSIPAGGQRILTNDICANQAFVMGPHLAIQFHIEMTPAMITEWCAAWPSEVHGLDALPPTIQRPEQMQAETASRLPAMRSLANQLYSVWISGLQH